MEKQLISGEFTSNKNKMTVSILFAVLSLIIAVAAFVLAFDIVSGDVVIGGALFLLFAGLFCVLAYEAYKTKDQELIVTDCRVYGRINKYVFTVPIESITTVSLNNGKDIIISYAAGTVISSCCVNGSEVYNTIMAQISQQRK